MELHIDFSDIELQEAQLNFERGIWLVHKAADERANHRDARLAQERQKAMDRIDVLLDNMHFVEVDYCAEATTTTEFEPIESD